MLNSFTAYDCNLRLDRSGRYTGHAMNLLLERLKLGFQDDQVGVGVESLSPCNGTAGSSISEMLRCGQPFLRRHNFSDCPRTSLRRPQIGPFILVKQTCRGNARVCVAAGLSNRIDENVDTCSNVTVVSILVGYDVAWGNGGCL